MMAKMNAPDVKNDMLTTGSNVQEVLRALFFYGPDYIMIKMGRRERLVHKEQLVALLELGREMATIEEIMSVVLHEPMSARMHLEDIPPDTPLLVFAQHGGGSSGGLSRMTFEEFRERRIKESAVALPDWWDAPLPLLYADSERVSLNDACAKLMPCDAHTLARQSERMLGEKMVTVRDKKEERTFSLAPLDENVFLVEDISGDFEMAEELVWWAAVGKAFFRRLEENGAVIRRLSPYETPPEGAAEVVSCSWDGELIGLLAMGLPEDMPEEAPAKQEDAKKSEQSEQSEHPGESEQPEQPETPEQVEGPEKTDIAAEMDSEPKDADAPGKSQPVKKSPKRTKKDARPAMAEKPKNPGVLREPERKIDLTGMGQEHEPARKKKRKAEAPGVWNESFGPFGRPAGSKKRQSRQTPKREITADLVTEEDIGIDEARRKLELEEALEISGNLTPLNKNAARRAYGGAAAQGKTARDAGGNKG
jgi:hypothetical protein